jgi:hypothetical protein
MAGLDSLGDEAELPFDWDLSRLLNFDPAGAPAVMDDGDDGKQELQDGADEFAYQYKLDTVVFLRPMNNAALSFWLGKVVRLGEGDHLGEYELWWFKSKRPFGVYHPWYTTKRKPMVDWQLESSIQDSVVPRQEDQREVGAKNQKLPAALAAGLRGG